MLLLELTQHSKKLTRKTLKLKIENGQDRLDLLMLKEKRE